MNEPNNFEYSDVPSHELDHHEAVDPHHGGSRLAEVILGGQDGLVNVLGVILGLAAATHESRIILAGGLAAAFAESVSMAAVAFTSTRAEFEHRESERQREHRHIEQVPALERREIEEIYRRKGFRGKLLQRIVDRITADRDVWVAVMMTEEHQLTSPPHKNALSAAAIVGVAALVGSIIPLVPFPFLAIGPSIVVSMILSAVSLFVVGWYKGRATLGRPTRSGIELTVIGMLSAIAGYAVGLLFRNPEA
jgi:VIT1/CCC1 family predicted Fe2+/Mn2+ transporter